LEAMRSTAIYSVPTVEVPPITSGHLSLIYSLSSQFHVIDPRAQVTCNSSHSCLVSSRSCQLLAKHCAHRSNLTLLTDIPLRLCRLPRQARPPKFVPQLPWTTFLRILQKASSFHRVTLKTGRSVTDCRLPSLVQCLMPRAR
jgi:hypothetical protein